MEEYYLVINSGSSSVKFSLYAMPGSRLITKGNVEKIGKEDCSWIIKYNGKKIKGAKYLKSHVEAVNIIINTLLENNILSSVDDIKGIGHRVLHGASLYKDSVIINDSVLKDIEDLTPLGPLHHPGEVAGIKCMRELLPNVPNVAVFDTAFHQTMPKKNFLYSVPLTWYEQFGVRKYGFHGTSYKYLTEYTKNLLNKEKPNLIICHIGSGASICCIKDGVCYDTSMGLTPNEGLMMCTRSGNIDPSIFDYISKTTGKSVSEINKILNEKSGLLGLAGYNDFRDIQTQVIEKDDYDSKIALEVYLKAIKRYIAEYYFELNGKVDALILSAGIGENSPIFRKWLLDELKGPLGIDLNEEENKKIGGGLPKDAGEITTNDSKTRVLVIPTDEEKMIMLDTYRLVQAKKKKISR